MDAPMIACSCGLDPATETMAMQAGIAAVLSAPFWFRSRLSQAVRIARRRLVNTPEHREQAGDDEPGGSPPA